jgi:Sulfotransferase family
MPIVKIDRKLVYYGHIPKCGGSAVEDYLHSRFGHMALLDTKFMSQSEAQRWSKTSPQHIDITSLNRLFPSGFFDLSFSVVRHPVDRLVSVFHFQKDVEKLIQPDVQFSEWLRNLEARLRSDPFQFDNHLRPMADLVPANAKLFFLEHGLECLIPWFDEVAGDQKGPRAMPLTNERGAYSKIKLEKAVPSSKDIDIIGRVYEADFSRFGYEPGRKLPLAVQPKAFKAKHESQSRGERLSKIFLSKSIDRIKRHFGM